MKRLAILFSSLTMVTTFVGCGNNAPTMPTTANVPTVAAGPPNFSVPHHGRGIAVGDLDNDGRPDVVINHCNEPVVLLRNVLNSGHHWLGVELVGKPNADAIGAKLTLATAKQQLLRVVKGGGSYLSSSDRRVLFGLGDETNAGKLTVRWPSGKVQTRENLGIDRYWRLTEGEAEAKPPRPINAAT